MVKETEMGRECAVGYPPRCIAVPEASAVHVAAIGVAVPCKGGPSMNWARVLAYITGTMDQEPLAWNQDLVAENRIPKARLKDGSSSRRPSKSRLARCSLPGPKCRPHRGRNYREAGYYPAWYRKLITRK
jgi:hypothetical protein